MLTWLPQGSRGILYGLFSPTEQARFTCPTANCTWPAFDSLGVCTRCTDIASSVSTKCRNTTMDFGIGQHFTGSKCKHTTPNNITFENTYIGTLCASPDNHYTLPCYRSMNPIPFIHVSSWEKEAEDKGSLHPFTADPSGRLLDVAFLKFSSNISSRPLSDAPNTIHSAFQCSLSVCLKTYGSSRFQTGLLNDVPTYSQNMTLGSNCTVASMSRSSRYGSCDALPTEPWMLSDGHTGYEVSWKGLWDLAASTVSTLSPDVLPASASVKINFEMPLIVQYAYNNFFDQDFLHMMESIATGMTRHIRDTPEAISVRGAAWIPTTFVKVRWPWFAYPVSLVLLSSVFWLMAAFFSTKGNMRVWKSSSLALLFCRLDRRDEDENNTGSIKDLECAGKRIKAQLVEDTHGSVLFVRA